MCWNCNVSALVNWENKTIVVYKEVRHRHLIQLNEILDQRNFVKYTYHIEN